MLRKSFTERNNLEKIEFQTESMNERTKTAVIQIIETLIKVSKETYGKKTLDVYIAEILQLHARYNVFILKDFNNMITGLNISRQVKELKGLYVNNFIEDIFSIMLNIDSNYIENIEEILFNFRESLNSVFESQKYQFVVQEDYLIYETTSKEEDEEIGKLLVSRDEVSKYISEALKSYPSKPGNAILNVNLAFENLFKNKYNFKNKRLGKMISELKNKEQLKLSNNDVFNQIKYTLQKLYIIRSNTNGSAHDGDKNISVKETKYLVMSAVSLLNFLKQD